jgi:hypothetical protein
VQTPTEGMRFMARLRSLAAAAAVALAVSLLLTGCATKRPAEVTSAWPIAASERVVPRPPEPVLWPLSGRIAPDAQAITRRPLSVKIENSPAARPQTGLNSADVVYESVAEGGITRFNAIFQSQVPRTVGPVRSARLSDIWIVPQYHALFVFSGASYQVNKAVRAAGLPNLSQDAGVSVPYSRSSSRSAPHNLFLNTKRAYAEAAKRGMSVTEDVPKLQFSPRTSAQATTITVVSIPFSYANKVTWTYKPAAKQYFRVNDGAKHLDAATNKQIAASNVVVLWARHMSSSRDKLGSTTYDINLGGSGRASVFRNGQRFDGTWTADNTAPPRFTAADGRPIKLAPGNTWFQVIPLNVSITMK